MVPILAWSHNPHNPLPIETGPASERSVLADGSLTPVAHQPDAR